MRYLTASLLALTIARPAFAEPPSVATDILPVQALVSRVMDGVGTPDLILPPNASPHGYALRPSEARSLERAEVVVWVGPALTPWMEGPIETLAGDAVHLTLMDVEGSTIMAFREGATFAAHDHDHDHGHEDEAEHDDHDHAEEEGHDEHAHEDEESHDEHDHEKEEGHDDHAHEGEDGHDDHAHEDEEGHDDHEHKEAAAHDDEDDHGHDEHGHDEHAEGVDPHVWLDPRNAAVWLDSIADTLATLDPANADAYRANAEAGQAELAELETSLSAMLAPVTNQRFIVFHDAFHYFEARFGVEASAAISAGDAAKPGAARIAELRADIAESGAVCAFAEPQFNPDLLATVTEGHEVQAGVLDPMGASIPMGPQHYVQTLNALGKAIAECLTR